MQTSMLRTMLFFMLFLLGFSSQEAKATHVMGVDLTYVCLGNNQYKFSLQAYRDCNGVYMGTTTNLRLSSPNCSAFTTTMVRTSIVEITPSCPGIVGTACNGGNGIYGIEKYTYEATVTIPTTCTDWTASWSLCCRNNAITTLTNPGSNTMYVETELNTGLAACNNSPTFLNNPTPFACVGQSVFYNHGAVDTDGDSLYYSLTDCYSAANTPVTYDATQGISASSPLITNNGVSINPATGAISFTPSSPQVGVLCVLVEEFRNGQKIGEIVRDIQFTVVNCQNQAPTLTGMNGGAVFDTTIAVGQQLCFEVLSYDVDSGQQTFIYGNNAIPNAVFTTSGNPFQNGLFCWTPSAADLGFHSFTLNVQDDACPLVGQNTYTYSINVVGGNNDSSNCAGLIVNLDTIQDLACTTNDGQAMINATGGAAPYQYSVINWTTGEIFQNSSGVFTNLTAGQYGIWVEDANGCEPNCSSLSFEIDGQVRPLNAQIDVINPSCATSGDGGSIGIAAFGGTAPYLYSIGAGFSSDPQFNQLAAGNYQVVVLDANGCAFVDSVTVTIPAPLDLYFTGLTAPNCGQANGSISLNVSGGTAPYILTANGQSVGNTITGLAEGTYQIALMDVNGCSYDTTVTLSSTPNFGLRTKVTSLSCAGDCNGSATVVASGSSGYTYNWSNGATTNQINQLCAGTYTVEVTDSSGCTEQTQVIIVEPAPINLAVLSSQEPSCANNDGALQLAVSGGTPPFQISLANLSTQTVQNNNNGQFTGLAAGQYTYQLIDLNGCQQECLGHVQLFQDCDSLNAGTLPNNGGISLTAGNYLLVNPNPAATMLQLRFAAEEAGLQIGIINLDGKSVFQRQGLAAEGSLELNIQSWTNGHYVVLLRNKAGKLIKSQKLVIQH
ncbi:T9SS type A sorting domain-containing protein [Saprospira sp. CCB-QB6]|uniref:T9SS type A sorting domain-containing protein n=1 Tax=Saprospira sp. CCB-QB6 TaxID=3023936 RepID=UPI00234A50D5|nr:T9SS type A sorting domain-containing protein [Saprospira sp. CCB-QB6]WCL82414.1 T9SS type A sorting domain-containing protein [Saprospira sp. CCB-QB6]